MQIWVTYSAAGQVGDGLGDGCRLGGGKTGQGGKTQTQGACPRCEAHDATCRRPVGLVEGEGESSFGNGWERSRGGAGRHASRGRRGGGGILKEAASALFGAARGRMTGSDGRSRNGQGLPVGDGHGAGAAYPTANGARMGVSAMWIGTKTPPGEGRDGPCSRSGSDGGLGCGSVGRWWLGAATTALSSEALLEVWVGAQRHAGLADG